MPVPSVDPVPTSTGPRFSLGWIPEGASLKDLNAEFKQGNSDQVDRLWHRIKGGHEYGDCLITCGTLPFSDAEGNRIGLVPSHAYAVLRIEEVLGHRMLQLKNP